MTLARERTARLGTCLAVPLLLALASDVASAAGDVKAGRMRAVMCQACHGVDGMSKVPDAPNIAGQPEGYLGTQLRAFKSGTRKNETMSVVTSTLSEKDIDDVAAYFAAIEVSVVKAPGT